MIKPYVKKKDNNLELINQINCIQNNATRRYESISVDFETGLFERKKKHNEAALICERKKYVNKLRHVTFLRIPVTL